MTCKKCHGAMSPGKAIQNTVTGTPDFSGGTVVTLSYGGHGKLIDCLKCSECGWSVSMPSEEKQSPPELPSAG